MLKIFYSFAVLFLSLQAVAQGSPAGITTSDQRISEVYADQYATLVLTDNVRHKMLTDMLQERTRFIVEKPMAGEKYPSISSVELFNKYNPQLERDAVGSSFVKENFNVLKYKIPFTFDRTLVYRIDGTDYLLVVEPQKTRK
ncbi:MAG: hypothetical protein EOP49_10175 [Sphingobacteriales bacterium]|nr:MAG: hypothetical protein EOP49_10175 [Sphingobacteriales bacterium]